MTLRTKSRGMRALVWSGAACACMALYVLSVRFWGTGHAAAWYAPEQMRFFLPWLVVFGWIAYETRWDGIRRESRGEKKEVRSCEAETRKDEEGENEKRKDQQNTVAKSSATPLPPPVAPALSSTCEAWERAREMPHEWIPNLEKDADYLKLVFQAADEGCVPALMKLAEYAKRRKVLVEAYFWTALAEKRGHAAARQEMLDIRKKWMISGCRPERKNVYTGFTQERGSVGRALLAVACGINVALARKRLRDLAAEGQSDACLLADMPLRPSPK